MDIMIIKSNTENRGSKLADSSVDLKSDVKELLSIVETIGNVWQDATSLTNINNLRDTYISNLSQLSITLGIYGDNLKKVPQAYTTFDESFASKNIEV